MRKSFLLAVALSVLVLLLGSQFGIATAQPPDFAKAIAAQEKHNSVLLSLPGVAGTGVGINASGAAVIRIYVEARGVGVPPFLDNIPVEAVITGPFFARCAQTECPRPVPLGVSTGHPDITAGTVGARVKDSSGNVYALSNNHVYANSNNASIGDAALQPGPYDGGSDPAHSIGTLAAFKAIDFNGGNNEIDAAIAVSTTAKLGNSTLSGYTPTSEPVEGTVNLPVKKQGRTTGLTVGQISEVNVTVTVCYAALGRFCRQSAKFVNQLAIGGGTFSAGGDSGSLIVTQSGDGPVGLLFAGSSTRTIANPIQAVLDWFGVTIDGASGGGSTDNPPTGDGITLTAVGYKVKGVQRADLSWSSPGTSTNVDVRRNNELIITTNDDGSHTDNINMKGGGSYTYQVCHAGTSTCSNSVTINF